MYKILLELFINFLLFVSFLFLPFVFYFIFFPLLAGQIGIIHNNTKHQICKWKMSFKLFSFDFFEMKLLSEKGFLWYISPLKSEMFFRRVVIAVKSNPVNFICFLSITLEMKLLLEKGFLWYISPLKSDMFFRRLVIKIKKQTSLNKSISNIREFRYYSSKVI